MVKTGNVIKLNDQKNYVVVNTTTYENNEYGYLCEIGNVENIKIVQFETNNQLSIVGNNENALLAKLILLFTETDR